MIYSFNILVIKKMFCDKCGKGMIKQEEEFYHLETEQVLCEDCYFYTLIGEVNTEITLEKQIKRYKERYGLK